MDWPRPIWDEMPNTRRDNGGTVPWLLSLLAIDGAVGLLVTRILDSWRRDLRSAGLLQP